MDYDTLVQAAKDWLETNETTFNSQIDQFIKLAEEDIYRRVQIKDLRTNSTTAMVASSSSYTLPTDFLAPYHFAVTTSGSESILLQKDPSFIKEVFLGASEGLPRYYAQEDDDNFLLGPTPDQNYAVDLYYYYTPASLVDGAGSGTTWLSTNAEQALLYGTVLQGYTFLKGDDDVMAQYTEQYTQAIAALKIIQEGRTEKDTNRRENPRLPV